MQHDAFMRRALALAENGKGWTNPNPMVGAVIVKDDHIIGEGWHKAYGGPHAEVEAFASLTENAEGATLYVTLEPCSHYGKTPPCADAIITHKIAKVFIAMVDPNPLVAGEGIEKLKAAGISVSVGLCEMEAMQLNEIFIHYIAHKLPFCVLKTAMTLDGKIATVKGNSKWITGPIARAHVHQLRHQVAGILTGIGTILADDPSLDTRLDGQRGSNPLRIIADTHARTPLTAKVMQTAIAPTLIVCTELADQSDIEALREVGAEVLILPSENDHVPIRPLIAALGKRGIDSILIEGGSEINAACLMAGVVQKIVTFIAPKIIGGSNAKGPVGGDGIHLMGDAIPLERVSMRPCGDDILIEGYLKKEVLCSQD